MCQAKDDKETSRPSRALHIVGLPDDPALSSRAEMEMEVMDLVRPFGHTTKLVFSSKSGEAWKYAWNNLMNFSLYNFFSKFLFIKLIIFDYLLI